MMLVSVAGHSHISSLGGCECLSGFSAPSIRLQIPDLREEKASHAELF